MNNKLVINFIPGKTTLHRMAGSTKVLLFVLFTLAVIVTFDIRVLLPLMVFPFAAIVSMKPNYKPLIFLFSFMFVTVGIIGTIMLLVVSPDVGMTHVGSHTEILRLTDRLYVTSETLWYVLITFTKRIASFAIVIAFVLMTTPSEFASGLSFLKMPYKICIIVSLAYRTIPDIARRFIDIRNSMQMRGVELNSKRTTLGKRLKYTGAMLVPLIISSFGRVETIANAMDLRGFGRLKKRTWYAEHELTRADRIARAFSAVFTAAILFYIIYTKIINPYPVNMWCPFVQLENITKINVIDTIFFMKWFD